jgi:hypothetical protein
MFVRKKTTRSGTVKHYLVECRREGGKVRQKVLWCLGEHQTVEAELAYLEQRARQFRETAAKYRAMAEAGKADDRAGKRSCRDMTEIMGRQAGRYEQARERLLAILQGQHV